MTYLRTYCAQASVGAVSRKVEKSATTFGKLLLLVAGIGATLGGCDQKQHESPHHVLVAGKVMLVGVTVVDTQGGKLTPHMNILMDQGKIVSITPADTAAL